MSIEFLHACLLSLFSHYEISLMDPAVNLYLSPPLLAAGIFILQSLKSYFIDGKNDNSDFPASKTSRETSSSETTCSCMQVSFKHPKYRPRFNLFIKQVGADDDANLRSASVPRDLNKSRFLGEKYTALSVTTEKLSLDSPASRKYYSKNNPIYHKVTWGIKQIKQN